MMRIVGIAIAATALAALTVGCGSGGSPAEGDDGTLGTYRSEAGAQNSAEGSASTADKGVSLPATAGSDARASAAASTDRKVIFTATLSLQSDDVQATFAAVEQAARSAAGYVQKSSLGTRRGADGIDRASASITIRVPAERYEATLSDLRALPGVKVEREDANATEVTEEYTDLESRLRNLERSESQYLALLQQARTIQEILTVNERVDSVRSQIEQTKGRMRLLEDLTDLATITASISTPAAAAVTDGDGGPKSFTSAFRDAWNGAEDAGRHVLAAGAVATVAAIWLALPAALVAAFAFRVRRHSSRATARSAAV